MSDNLIIANAKEQDLQPMLDVYNEAILNTAAVFKEVAYFKEVGYKFGRWLDLKFLELILD
jgi:phosphinothricin acetyltransferase